MPWSFGNPNAELEKPVGMQIYGKDSRRGPVAVLELVEGTKSIKVRFQGETLQDAYQSLSDMLEAALIAVRKEIVKL